MAMDNPKLYWKNMGLSHLHMDEYSIARLNNVCHIQ
jgi:hypothetical protein